MTSPSGYLTETFASHVVTSVSDISFRQPRHIPIVSSQDASIVRLD
jgi:hypothetical protein